MTTHAAAANAQALLNSRTPTATLPPTTPAAQSAAARCEAERENRHYLPEETAMILRRLTDGKSLAEIARFSDRSESAIHEHIRRLVSGRTACPAEARKALEIYRQHLSAKRRKEADETARGTNVAQQYLTLAVAVERLDRRSQEMQELLESTVAMRIHQGRMTAEGFCLLVQDAAIQTRVLRRVQRLEHASQNAVRGERSFDECIALASVSLPPASAAPADQASGLRKAVQENPSSSSSACLPPATVHGTGLPLIKTGQGDYEQEIHAADLD